MSGSELRDGLPSSNEMNRKSYSRVKDQMDPDSNLLTSQSVETISFPLNKVKVFGINMFYNCVVFSAKYIKQLNYTGNPTTVFYFNFFFKTIISIKNQKFIKMDYFQ